MSSQKGIIVHKQHKFVTFFAEAVNLLHFSVTNRKLSDYSNGCLNNCIRAVYS